MDSPTVRFWEEGVKAGCFGSFLLPSLPTGLACGLILSTGVVGERGLPSVIPLAGYPWVKTVVQSLSCVQLFATPQTAACQASLPSRSPRICSNSCPLSQWCHPTISSSVTPFSSCPPSFPASGSFLPVANRTQDLQDVASLFIRGFLSLASSASLS